MTLENFLAYVIYGTDVMVRVRCASEVHRFKMGYGWKECLPDRLLKVKVIDVGVDNDELELYLEEIEYD